MNLHNFLDTLPVNLLTVNKLIVKITIIGINAVLYKVVPSAIFAF